MRAKRELEEEEARIKDLKKPPESPLQIRGGINIGDIDLTAMQQQREQELAAERAAASDRAQQQEAENKRLHEQLYNERVESMRKEFSEKMEALRQTIAGGGNQKTFSEQYAELVGMARELGLEKTGTGKDPMVELELAKLNFQQSKEEREFKWKMRQDEKTFAMQMEQMKQDREFRQAELMHKAKRDDLFASFPDMVGRAIAKGLVDSEQSAISAGMNAPISNRPAPAAKSGKLFHIEVGEGESGEIACGNCGTPVGVGSTSTEAVCVNCNSRFDIVRKPLAEITEEE